MTDQIELWERVCATQPTECTARQLARIVHRSGAHMSITQLLELDWANGVTGNRLWRVQITHWERLAEHQRTLVELLV